MLDLPLMGVISLMTNLRWLMALAFIAVADDPARAGLPSSPPASLGFDAERLKRIDAAIDRAIEHKEVPGVVVLVGRRGSIAYARAAGRRAVEPKPEPMTRDTVFDMASLTKPIATATSVMILARGRQGPARRPARSASSPSSTTTAKPRSRSSSSSATARASSR